MLDKTTDFSVRMRPDGGTEPNDCIATVPHRTPLNMIYELGSWGRGKGRSSAVLNHVAYLSASPTPTPCRHLVPDAMAASDSSSDQGSTPILSL